MDSDDGQNILAPPGAVMDFGGIEHPFKLTSPLREGKAGKLALDQSSEATLLVVSLELQQLVFPGTGRVLALPDERDLTSAPPTAANLDPMRCRRFVEHPVGAGGAARRPEMRPPRPLCCRQGLPKPDA